MNKKFIKIFVVLLLIFSLYINISYATDINLNLPGTSDSNSIQQNNEVKNSANELDNTNPSQNIDNSVQNNDFNSQDLSNSNVETLSPADISSATESGLGITNIINILLITVGVILILLAIAIIIRLRN